MKKIAILVGSLRKNSNSGNIAAAFKELTSSKFECFFPEIGDLPFFNQDLEDAPPASWERFRKEVKSADALLIITPEYNRSMPAVLKNALDVGSRPHGQSVFSGKPAGLISSSIGALGGFGANHHIRQVLAFLNVPTMSQPEMYIGTAQNNFENGKIKEPKYIKQFADALDIWISKFC